MVCEGIESLANYRIILEVSKLKAVADVPSNITQMVKFVVDWVEYIVGKREALCTSISSCSQTVLKKFSSRVVKTRDRETKNESMFHCR